MDAGLPGGWGAPRGAARPSHITWAVGGEAPMGHLQVARGHVGGPASGVQCTLLASRVSHVGHGGPPSVCDWARLRLPCQVQPGQGPRPQIVERRGPVPESPQGAAWGVCDRRDPLGGASKGRGWWGAGSTAPCLVLSTQWGAMLGWGWGGGMTGGSGALLGWGGSGGRLHPSRGRRRVCAETEMMAPSPALSPSPLTFPRGHLQARGCEPALHEYLYPQEMR